MPTPTKSKRLLNLQRLVKYSNESNNKKPKLKESLDEMDIDNEGDINIGYEELSDDDDDNEDENKDKNRDKDGNRDEDKDNDEEDDDEKEKEEKKSKR
ncbi:unnamed protein product [Rhizophagus irregularis]|nr:unnamed protein product [Rhizophagus irregularis]